jgi:hypothetical protein
MNVGMTVTAELEAARETMDPPSDDTQLRQAAFSYVDRLAIPQGRCAEFRRLCVSLVPDLADAHEMSAGNLSESRPGHNLGICAPVPLGVV